MSNPIHARHPTQTHKREFRSVPAVYQERSDGSWRSSTAATGAKWLRSYRRW